LREGREAMGFRLCREGDETRFVAERIAGVDLVPAPDGYYRLAHASMAILLSGGIPGAWEIG
jgi:hypothetical protein